MPAPAPTRVFTGIASDGSPVAFRDRKRYAYLLAYTYPAVYLAAFLAFLVEPGAPLLLCLPLLYVFGVTPIVDMIVGEDTNNPPEAVIGAMMADDYYRYAILPLVGIAYLVLGAAVFIVGTHELPVWAFLVMIVATGTYCGGVLTLTHELGHKAARLDRAVATIGNALIGYGHFNVEHNRGHHAMVATPEDPASSRLGESIYRFALREIPGAFVRGLREERKRLAKLGHGFVSWRNEVLRSLAVTLLVALACVAAYGPEILLFILPVFANGWYVLTQANYVEHYGLLRRRLPGGQYERPRPHHSWNTNHLFSNLLLFHLQRHSDHHAHPRRPYQVLRHFADLPTLPSGYPGCFVLAAIPPLWFAVMDRRVLAQAGGDLTRVNLHPAARAKYLRRYASPSH